MMQKLLGINSVEPEYFYYKCVYDAACNVWPQQPYSKYGVTIVNNRESLTLVSKCSCY